MLSSQLLTFAQSNAFTVKENFAFGIFEGFFVTVSGKQSRKNAFISFYKEETEGDAFFNSELSEALNGISEQYSVIKYGILNNGVSVETTAELLDFDELLHMLCTLLAEKGAKGSAYCSSCGKEIAEEAAVRKVISFNGEFYLVCGNCALEILAQEQNLPGGDKFKKVSSKSALSDSAEDTADSTEDGSDGESQELAAKEALGLIDDAEETEGSVDAEQVYEESSEADSEAEPNEVDGAELDDEALSSPSKPKTKRGIAGAILGALLGLIAFVAAYIWLAPVVESALTDLFPSGNDYSLESEFVSLIFTAILGVLTYVFYSLFSGSKGLDRAAPCLIISALATAVAQYIGSVSIFVKESVISFEHFTRSFKYFWHFPITDDVIRRNFILLLMANLIVVIVVSFIFTVVSEGRVKRSALEVYDF